MSTNFGSAGGGSGGGALSPEDEETLKYFEYNPTTNKLEALRTISTEPSSIDIGNHTVSSGGENAFFTNRSNDIDWFPAWTGIKPQHEAVNQDHTGIIPPTFRHYTTDLMFLEIEGAAHASTVVDYDVISPTGAEVSVFSQEVILGEPVATDDWIFYTTELLLDDGITWKLVYQQTISDINLNAGDNFHWDFDHPLEGRAGSTIRSRMMIAKGDQDATRTYLQVRATAADDTRRYVNVGLRNFTDEDVMSGVIPVNTSQIIRYAATYPVDTTAGAVTLTADRDVGYNSFVVFDADQNFNMNSCIVDFGAPQGTATLQTKNDSFLFYWDGTQWKYLDLNTKDGGVV
jgi:hypothetical protein